MNTARIAATIVQVLMVTGVTAIGWGIYRMLERERRDRWMRHVERRNRTREAMARLHGGKPRFPPEW